LLHYFNFYELFINELFKVKNTKNFKLYFKKLFLYFNIKMNIDNKRGLGIGDWGLGPIPNPQSPIPTWNSGTHNKRGKTAPYRVVMQNDGNAVLYDAKNKPLWASNSNGKGRPPYNFIMQDDGNLVLYDGSNSPKWASNTNNKQ
jgi:hypothetical protein